MNLEEIKEAIKALNNSGLGAKVSLNGSGKDLAERFMQAVEAVPLEKEAELPQVVVDTYNTLVEEFESGDRKASGSGKSVEEVKEKKKEKGKEKKERKLTRLEAACKAIGKKKKGTLEEFVKLTDEIYGEANEKESATQVRRVLNVLVYMGYATEQDGIYKYEK